MKQHTRILLLLVVLVLGVVGLWRLQGTKTSSTPLQTLQVGQKKLHVEVASTSQAIVKGLGERDRIGSDGMLFVLGGRSIPVFWMKGMRFNLDFVWIANNTVVEITPNVKAQPGVSDAQLQTYAPRLPADMVLEIDAGNATRWNIRVGDTVHLY